MTWEDLMAFMEQYWKDVEKRVAAELEAGSRMFK